MSSDFLPGQGENKVAVAKPLKLLSTVFLQIEVGNANHCFNEQMRSTT